MFNDTMLNSMANHASGLITHIGIASADPGAAGTLNAVGTRAATSGKVAVDADGDITWTGLAYTGLAANQSVSYATYWSAATAGTFYGSQLLTGDASANSSGEFNISTLTETGTSST